MKFSIKNFFRKYDQIRMKLRIWLHLLKKSLMENFIFCAAWDDKNWMCCFFKVQIFEKLPLIMIHQHCVRKCPNAEFFLVRIFPYSDQKKLCIWTLFTQCNALCSETYSEPCKTSKMKLFTNLVNDCNPKLGGLFYGSFWGGG